MSLMDFERFTRNNCYGLFVRCREWGFAGLEVFPSPKNAVPLKPSIEESKLNGTYGHKQQSQKLKSCNRSWDAKLHFRTSKVQYSHLLLFTINDTSYFLVGCNIFKWILKGSY